MITGILRPSDRAGLYEVVVDGSVLCRHRDPGHTAARALLAQGRPPETLLTLRWEDGQPSMKPTPIGELALWTIQENDRGLRRVPYRQWQGPGAEA